MQGGKSNAAYPVTNSKLFILLFNEKNPGGLNIPTIIFTFVDY